MSQLIYAALLVGWLFAQTPVAPAHAACQTMHITGYVPGTPSVPSLHTADGSYVFSGEALAASTSLPFGTYVSIADLADYGLPSTYRIADRGWLDPNQIDVLVWTGDVASSVRLARAFTGQHEVCLG